MKSIDIKILYDEERRLVTFESPGGNLVTYEENDAPTWHAIGDMLVRHLKAFGKDDSSERISEGPHMHRLWTDVEQTLRSLTGIHDESYTQWLKERAANEIGRLRGLLEDLLNDCENWGCAPSDRYAAAIHGESSSKRLLCPSGHHSPQYRGVLGGFYCSRCGAFDYDGDNNWRRSPDTQ